MFPTSSLVLGGAASAWGWKTSSSTREGRLSGCSLVACSPPTPEGPMVVRSLPRRQATVSDPCSKRRSTCDWQSGRPAPLRCGQHRVLPSLQAARPPATCLPFGVVHGVPQGTGVQGTCDRPRVGRAPRRVTFRSGRRSRRSGHQQWAGPLPALLPELQGARVTSRPRAAGHDISAAASASVMPMRVGRLHLARPDALRGGRPAVGHALEMATSSEKGPSVGHSCGRGSSS